MTIHLKINSRVFQLTDETHNTGPCFYLCDGLNCGTHFVTGMGTLLILFAAADLLKGLKPEIDFFPAGKLNRNWQNKLLPSLKN
jgi:hypothetical protein